VFVLTDGEVSNTEQVSKSVRACECTRLYAEITLQVIEICRQNAHNSRVFTIGIGNQVSRALVEGMARAAGESAKSVIIGWLRDRVVGEFRVLTASQTARPSSLSATSSSRARRRSSRRSSIS
jgi:hypothetical protein